MPGVFVHLMICLHSPCLEADTVLPAVPATATLALPPRNTIVNYRYMLLITKFAKDGVLQAYRHFPASHEHFGLRKVVLLQAKVFFV